MSRSLHKLGICGITTMGRGALVEGNLMLRDVRELLAASPWYILLRGLVSKSQLYTLACVDNHQPSKVRLPERSHICHLVYCNSQGDCEQHGTVRDSPLQVLVHTRFWPRASYTKLFDKGSRIAGCQSAERHDERASTAISLRLASEIP